MCDWSQDIMVAVRYVASGHACSPHFLHSFSLVFSEEFFDVFLYDESPDTVPAALVSDKLHLASSSNS